MLLQSRAVSHDRTVPTDRQVKKSGFCLVIGGISLQQNLLFLQFGTHVFMSCNFDYIQSLVHGFSIGLPGGGGTQPFFR